VFALFYFLIVGYGIYEGRIAGYGDIFHAVADKEEEVWIRLAVIALVSIFTFSSLIFAGLLIFFKRNKNSG
jgi:hypothetical protein